MQLGLFLTRLKVAYFVVGVKQICLHPESPPDIVKPVIGNNEAQRQ